MYNNYVEEAAAYQPSSTILEPQEGRGALLLGDFNSVSDMELIDKYRIRTIITAAVGLEHITIDPSISHITYPVADLKSENISSFFNESYETIEESLERGSVLVHCAAGVSRSATIVIAYLMKKYKWTFRQTLTMVKQKRPQVCPNLGFEMQLKHYEKQLLSDGKCNRVCKTLIPIKKLIEFPERAETAIEVKGNVHGRLPQISSISKTSVRKKRDLSQLGVVDDRHHGRMSSHLRQPHPDLIMSGTPGYNSCLTRNRDSILQTDTKPNSIHISRKIEQSRQLDFPEALMSSSKLLGRNGRPQFALGRPSMRLNLKKVDVRIGNPNTLKR